MASEPHPLADCCTGKLVKPDPTTNAYRVGPGYEDVPATAHGDVVTAIHVEVTEDARNAERYEVVADGGYQPRVSLVVKAETKTTTYSTMMRYKLRFVDNFGSNRVATHEGVDVPAYVVRAVEEEGYDFIGVRPRAADQYVVIARMLAATSPGDRLSLGWLLDITEHPEEDEATSAIDLTIETVESEGDEQAAVTARGEIAGEHRRLRVTATTEAVTVVDATTDTRLGTVHGPIDLAITSCDPQPAVERVEAA